MFKYIFALLLSVCSLYATTNDNYLWSATNTQTQFYYDAANKRFTNNVILYGSNNSLSIGSQDDLTRAFQFLFTNNALHIKDSASSYADMLQVSNASGIVYLLGETAYTPTLGIRDIPFRSHIINKPKWEAIGGNASIVANVGLTETGIVSPYTCISNAQFRVTVTAFCTNVGTGNFIMGVGTYGDNGWATYVTNTLVTLPLTVLNTGVSGTCIVSNNYSLTSHPLCYVLGVSGYSSGTGKVAYRFIVEQLE